MKIYSIFIQTLTNSEILGAIFSTLFIIGLGFYLRKKNIFPRHISQVLSKVVLLLSLPCLIFESFMTSLDKELLIQSLNVFVWGFVGTILLLFIIRPLYTRYNQNQRDILEVLTIFGSTSFFGIPIANAILGEKGVVYGSLLNIGLWVLHNSYGYIRISQLSMNKQNIKKVVFDPVILATIIGFCIWIFQDITPHVSILREGSQQSVSFLRIDVTLPWLYSIVKTLGSTSSPLAWLAIGATLSEIPFKKALVNPTSWYLSFNKTFLSPFLNLIVLLILTLTGWLPFNFTAISVIIILLASPVSTVAVFYAINSQKEPLLASNASLISSLLSGIAMPFWIIALEMIKNLNII